MGSPTFWSCDRINISMLNTNTNLILRVSLLSGNKVMIVDLALKLNLPPMTYISTKVPHGMLKNEIYYYLEQCIYCKVIKQCLPVKISQQKASHLTGIYLDYSTAYQGKLEIDSLKQCLYSKIINQCLTDRIPQHNAFHLTGIYLN